MSQRTRKRRIQKRKTKKNHQLRYRGGVSTEKRDLQLKLVSYPSSMSQFDENTSKSKPKLITKYIISHHNQAIDDMDDVEQALAFGLFNKNVLKFSPTYTQSMHYREL